MAGVEIASAYVALTTKMPGVKQDIENELGKVDAEGAGGKVGEGLGRGITNKQAAIAGAVGGIFASIANNVATGLGNLIGDAIAQSDAGDKFAQTLDFAGLDTSAIDAAIAKSQGYADSTVYDLTTVQNTTAQLAANGVKNYSELTEAAGNLNAVAGGNQSTFESVAMMLSQTAGAGKLTTENWNQLADAIPGASGRLQQALADAGAYTGNFREAMEKGQITADEFNAALLELGSEPIAVEAATSVTTMEGAAANLASTITGRLAGAFDVIKPALTAITSAFAGFIANSQIFVPVIAGLGAALLYLLAPAIWAAVVATAAWTVALLANPTTWIVLAIVALVAALVALAMNWDTVVQWITTVWGGFISWITGVINGFVGWWNGVWSAVGAWFSNVWNGIVQWGAALFARLYFGLMSIGAAISGWWNGLWAGISSFFKGIWDGILAAIRNVQSVFGQVFNAIASIVSGAFSGVAGIVRGVINNIIGAVNGVIGGINSVAGAIGGAIGVNIRVPTIPRLASGGIITGSSTGTLALVGEAGSGRDEAVLPLPSDWRENGLGGGGLRDGDALTLVVDGQQFRGYVQSQAVSVVRDAAQPFKGGRR